MARLKAAVIGCGRMGADHGGRLDAVIPAGWLPVSHTESLLRTDHVELVALCDTDQCRLADRGAHYGISALYTDYGRLLDEVRPDIVTVATRTPGKSEIVSAACSAGVKGLYVEKPLANSLASCRAALAAVRESGASLFYGVNRRYHGTYRRALRLVSDGEIGDVRQVTVEHGRAQLLWTHPHSTDLLLLFAGTTAVVDAQARLVEATVERRSARMIDSDPVIEHAVFRFENGVLGTIGQAGGWNLRVAGTTGTLTVHADGVSITVDRAVTGQAGYFLDHSTTHPIGGSGATVTALAELAAAVTSGSQNESQLAAIESGTRMLLGCAWSSLNDRRIVNLAEVPDDLEVTGRYGEVYA